MHEIDLDQEPTPHELVPVTQSYAPPESVTLWGAATPAQIIEKAAEAATALAAVVDKQGLFSNIQGRKHVRVEGWTLLGSILGVFPVCVWTRQLHDPDGWEARVEARRGEVVIGTAEAQCTRLEPQWSYEPVGRDGRKLPPRDDYALRSMAQTRATSKALRMPLGFVVSLAGYEACPAEEMVVEAEIVASATPEAPKAPLSPAVQEMLDKAKANREKEQADLDRRGPVDRQALVNAGLVDPEISGNCEGCGAKMVKRGPIKKAGKYTGRYFMTCPNEKDKSVRHTWRAI